MNKDIKVYIAGHAGLVGSAVKRVFEANGYKNLVFRTHSELDLTNSLAVKEFFETERPDWVVLAAAKVGGIIANDTYPVEFFTENIKIQTNVIENSYANGVKKLCFLGSSCIYPKNAPQPLKEEYLLTSLLEKTNEMYALAKISGIKLCNAYNREYGTNFISVMPCSLYGKNDNYNENAHVIPMLIKRFHEAKEQNLSEVTVWGTGKPYREFLCVDDLASAILFLMENKDFNNIGEFINVGTGEDLTIFELVNLIKNVVGYKGEIIFDETKPDGTFRKLMDVSKIKSMGWSPKVSLEEGLKLVYDDFLSNKALRR